MTGLTQGSSTDRLHIASTIGGHRKGSHRSIIMEALSTQTSLDKTTAGPTRLRYEMTDDMKQRKVGCKESFYAYAAANMFEIDAAKTSRQLNGGYGRMLLPLGTERSGKRLQGRISEREAHKYATGRPGADGG